MSVINTMLKDLERRGVDCTDSNNNILGGLSANTATADAEERSDNLYVVSLISVILIMVVVIAVYYLSPYRLVPAQTVEPGSVIASANTNANANAITPAATTTAENVSHPVTVKSVDPAQNTIQRTSTVPDQVSPVQTASIKPEVNLEVKPVKLSPAVAGTRNSAPIKKVNKKRDISGASSAESSPSISIRKIRPAEPGKPAAAINNPVVKTAAGSNPTISEQATDANHVVNKKQREASDEEKSQLAYMTARTLYDRGRTQRSKAHLQEALNFDSSNAEAYKLLSVIYLEDGRSGLATEVIEQGLTIHANDQELLRLYLQALVQNRKYSEAAAVMSKRLHLSTPEDLSYLAGLYQKTNDHLNAVKLYSQALQLNPSRSIWWMAQGISLEHMKKYADALQSYQQSIDTGQLSGKLSRYTKNRIDSLKQANAESLS